MIIEWHIINGKAEAYTIHNICCKDWDDLEHYINFQPTGLYLEVPNYVEFDLLNPRGFETDIPIVRWAKLGKLGWCPFCGIKVDMYKTVVTG